MSDERALTRLLAERGGTARTAGAWLAALLGHAALVAFAVEQEPALAAVVAVTEVDLLPPPQPTPPPPEPEPPAPAAQPAAPVRPARTRPQPPQPARAGALKTADEAAKTDGEPVRFVTDPNGGAFGFGAVARGGTADSAPTTAAPLPAAPQPGPAPSLGRPPRLTESDPCRGFFPTRARVDRGEVALKVRVERDGIVRSVAVSREHPLGQGFGFAARDCLLSKRFSPGLDRAGKPVAVVSPVTVRFSR